MVICWHWSFGVGKLILQLMELCYLRFHMLHSQLFTISRNINADHDPKYLMVSIHVVATRALRASKTLARNLAMAPGPVKNWRFAPLDPKRSNPANKPKLEGIVFDVDGTLCKWLRNFAGCVHLFVRRTLEDICFAREGKVE